MIYIIIGVLIILLTYLEAILKDRRFSQYSAMVILFIMLLLVGFRDKVGTDWVAYFNFYKETTDKVEVGYAFLNNLFSSLSIPYNVFLLFINGLALSLMFVFLKRNSYLLIIGLLIFYSDLFLYFNLSGIRQGIALSITCFSINYAINKQFFKFLLMVLLAACFHTTAVVFIIAYFLPKEKIKLKTILFVSIAFFLFNYFLQSISELITLYTLKNADFYTTKQEKADNLQNLFYIGAIKRSIIVVVILALGRKLFDLTNSYYFFNIYLFGLAIYLSSYLISPDIGTRLSSYFTIFEIVLAGNLIYTAKNRSIRILVGSLFSFIAIYKLLGYMNDEFYTYNSIICFFC